MINFDSLKQKIFKSDFLGKVSNTFITKIIMTVIGFATTVIVARILEPEGRGLFAIVMAITGMGVQFGNLGLHASNTYFTARCPEKFSELVSNSFLVCMILSPIIALIMLGVIYFFPAMLPIEHSLLIIGLIGIPFGLSYLLFQNLLLGKYEVKQSNKIDLFSKILYLFFVLMFYFSKLVYVETIFFSFLFSNIICLIWVSLKVKGLMNKPFMPSMDLFKETLQYGFKSYIACFLAFMVTRVDLFMFKYFMASEKSALGFYAVAVSLCDVISLVPVTFGSILFPKLSSMKTFSEKLIFTRKATLLSSLITFALIFTFILTSERVISIVLGKSYLPMVPMLFWLLISIIFFSLNNGYAQMLAAVGNSYLYSLAWLISLIVKVVISYLIINYCNYNLIGIGNVAVNIIVLLFTINILKRCDLNAETLNG